MAYNNNQTTKSSKRPRNYNDSAPRKGKNYGKKYDKASKYFDGPEYLKKKISKPKFEKPKSKNEIWTALILMILKELIQGL